MCTQNCRRHRPRLAHLLLQYMTDYNATKAVEGDQYVEYNLARMLVRLLSQSTYKAGGEEGLPLTFIENVFGYVEVNLAVTIAFPEGILLMFGE